jgi:hypothetical protein
VDLRRSRERTYTDRFRSEESNRSACRLGFIRLTATSGARRPPQNDTEQATRFVQRPKYHVLSTNVRSRAPRLDQDRPEGPRRHSRRRAALTGHVAPPGLSTVSGDRATNPVGITRWGASYDQLTSINGNPHSSAVKSLLPWREEPIGAPGAAFVPAPRSRSCPVGSGAQALDSN